MREIKWLVAHCTGTSPKAKISSIQNYWRRHLGWRMPGYHFIVKPDGTYEQLLDISKVSNGVYGYNQGSIHIAYIGGVTPNGNPDDTRTPEQIATMRFLFELHKEQFPKAKIQGHRDFPRVKKACPCYNAKREYRDI